MCCVTERWNPSQPWRYNVTVICSSSDIVRDTLLLKPTSFTCRVYGVYENPGCGNKLVDKEWFIHLEVLSTDTRMPGLANLEGVRERKKVSSGPKGKKPVYPAGCCGTTGIYADLRQAGRAVPAHAGRGNTGCGWLPELVVQSHREWLVTAKRC